MTIQYEDLVDPRETFLEAGLPAYIPAKKDDDPRLILIGVGIAAAIVGIKMIMSHRLRQERPTTVDEAKSIASTLWAGQRSIWRQLALPSISAAYAHGVTALTVTPDVLEKLAVLYADELGDYIFKTSTDAMVEGFASQLNNGMNVDTSWIRSTAGYGLDSKQTRQYIVTLTDHVKGQYTPEPIPEASVRAIDKMMLTRADRIGQNEAYKATQMGRNMMWSYMEKEGDLVNARKRWVTAEDEMVCPVCAPLDGVVIPLAQQFESAGQQFYAPGVHPNCRCEIVLQNNINIVKAMPGDPFDRAKNGRFSSIELRSAKTLPPIGQNYTPVGATLAPIGTMSTGIGFARAPIGQTLAPIAESVSPVALELPPIGEAEMFLAPKAKPPQPKIGNKALADVKVKVKNKAKAKVKVETPVETPVENKSPIAVKASYEADSPIEFHGRPLVVPASRYIKSAHMSNHKFYDAGANGQFVFLDGGFDLAGFVGESSKGLEQSKANIQAFNQEFQDILDEVTWATHVEPGISRENMPLEESTADGFDKRPAIVFVFERGWEGDIELGSDPDHPGWGVPVGWYRIDGPPEYIAAGKAGAFPESVQDQIEEGIGAEGFTDFYEASKYVNGRVNIRLVPVAPTEVDVDRILKRAPRLTLKRK